MVDGSCWPLSSVSLATSALISVAPQYRFSFSLPDLALIEFSFHNLSVQLTAYWAPVQDLNLPSPLKGRERSPRARQEIAAEAADKVVLEVGFQPWLQRLELHQRFQGYEPCEIAASPLCHERTLLSPPGIPKREERKAEAAEQIRIPYSLLGKVALMKNPPAFLVLL